MSLRNQIGTRAGGTSIIGKAARLMLYAGLTTGLAGALALGSAASAGAAPVVPGHQSGGQPGGGAPWWGASHFRHGYSGTVTGTVLSAPAATTVGPTVLTSTASTLPAVTASFTITPAGWRNTPVTVYVLANTRFREPGESVPGLGNILVGDQVTVRGMHAGTDMIEALSVELPLVLQTGTVLTNTATTVSPAVGVFTMGTAGRKSTNVTVEVFSTTTFREPGQTSSGLGGIMVGDQVIVRGTQGGGGIVDATSVQVPLVTDLGTVATVPSNPTVFPTSFTITTAGRTGAPVTVNVSSTTTFREPGQTSPGVGNLAVNVRVLVVGTQEGAATVGATAVLILPAGNGRGSPWFPGFPGGPGHHSPGR
jgi:hypothetical protein